MNNHNFTALYCFDDLAYDVKIYDYFDMPQHKDADVCIFSPRHEDYFMVKFGDLIDIRYPDGTPALILTAPYPLHA